MTPMLHLFWALVNSIWQSAALAALVSLAIRAMRRSTAAQRYALWASVLIACAILPIVNLALPARTFSLPSAPYAAAAAVRSQAAPVQADRFESASPIHDVGSPPGSQVDIAPVTPVWQSAASWIASNAIDLALAGWVLAGLLMLSRLALGYVRLLAAKRALVYRELGTAERQALGEITTRQVAVGFSDTIGEPCVIGFKRPVVTLPTRIAKSLPSADVVRVLRHECAHVSRYDDYGNLVQQIIVALFAFNPIVHVVARSLDIDREIACDDAAANAADDRVEFAKCLYEIARGNTRRAWLPAAGFARNRSQIVLRVAQLLDRNHLSSTRLGIAAKIAAIAILIAAIPLCYVQVAAMAAPQAVAPAPRVTPVAQAPAAKITPDGNLAPRAKPKALHKHIVVDKKIVIHKDTAPTPMSPVHRRLVRQAVTRFSEVVTSDAMSTETSMAVSSAMPVALRAPRAHVDGRRDDDFLGALHDAGFRNLSVDDLIALRDHGVGGDFIRELAADGMTPMPVDKLISLADNGIGADYIKSIRDAGYPNISTDDLIKLRNADVTGAYIQRLNKSSLGGPRPIPIDDLIKLRNAGV